MSPVQIWRGRVHNLRLEGGVCRHCGSRTVAVQVVCPDCQSGPIVRIPVEIVSSIPLFRRIAVPVPVRIR
jgi:uncharacterized OB-fold protein